MYVLEQQIEREQFPPETEQQYLEFIKEELAPRYAEFIGKEIQKAYLESYSEYGQNMFDRYVDLRRLLDRGPGIPRHRHRRAVDRELLNAGAREDREAGRHRQPEGLPQRDRQLRRCARAPTTAARTRAGPATRSCATVIEKRMFSHVEELLPVISFGSRRTSDTTKKKHEDFVNRMVREGLHGRAGAAVVRVVHAGSHSLE